MLSTAALNLAQKAQESFRGQIGISNNEAPERLPSESSTFQESFRELEQAERWEVMQGENNNRNNKQEIGLCQSGSEKAKSSVRQRLGKKWVLWMASCKEE